METDKSLIKHIIEKHKGEKPFIDNGKGKKVRLAIIEDLFLTDISNAEKNEMFLPYSNYLLRLNNFYFNKIIWKVIENDKDSYSYSSNLEEDENSKNNLIENNNKDESQDQVQYNFTNKLFEHFKVSSLYDKFKEENLEMASQT